MSQPANWGVPSVGPATPTAYASRDNGSLDALLSGHLFTARPSYAVQGTLWNKDTGASPQVIEQYWFDGTDDILLATFDVTANTVLFSFAAAQDFSPAGAYFGGNAAKNLFSFYEKDVFTPTLTFATPGDLVVTYTAQLGRYERIGDDCVFDIALVISDATFTTSSGNLRIGGLPFTADAAIYYNSGVLGSHTGALTYPAGCTRVAPRVVSSTDYIELVGMGSATSATTFTTAAITSGDAQNLRISGRYRVA